MPNYVKFKRDKVDICNICLQKRQLTWDHIPPKGGVEFTEVEQWNIMQHMVEKNTKHIPSQNGVKYRTLCQECNNSLLGAQYDPVINSFAEDVGQYLKSSLIIPEVIRFKTKPVKIVKAVLGHLLAAKGELSFSNQDVAFREYVLDHDMKVPRGYKVFYWVYPFNNIRIMQNFSMMKVKGSESGRHGMFSLLKYLPIAYLVTDLEYYEGLDELTQYCINAPDTEMEIPIRLNDLKNQVWPEVDDYNVLLTGDDIGVFAKPKIRMIKQR
ncbi:hypothetical protein HW560_15805 [Paenibacillus sp. E222]|uniref:hypothetical protein n=1 Tax=Paenibacillus sp. E222 TaxID=2748863 RepID=UPI0015C68413|nr:hypothetical protein [Paenibacillus sp. E222]QLG39412.1 hypothetical protein HW560_15805 [Paenibacillus sp. E222]